jgi:hypothetical protein
MGDPAAQKVGLSQIWWLARPAIQYMAGSGAPPR